MMNNRLIESGVDQRTLTERYTMHAEQFISQQSSDKPFFLYFAYTFPHVPLYLNEAWLGHSKRGKYGDKIEEIDASVGRVLAALEAQNLMDNTLVIFTSDNGPWLKKK